MTSTDSSIAQRVRRGRWWRESEVLLLIALVVGAYFIRAGDLSIRGEESRWATIAREMIRTGDWIVPRQQGEPFLSRPPLANWLIAMATLARGQGDVWAIRLPTLLAVLVTTILVYAFGRSFLNRLGALTAALAFCTMGEVLQMGRVAETDLLFTCLLSAAVLVWLWGERRGWPPWITWCGGYSLSALAALAKGPQAPVYFAGTVAIYLAIRRDWRMLFSKWHALGMATFIIIVGLWQIPFTSALGWGATRQIWTGDSAARFENLQTADILKHLATYPLEVMGCTAPWSFFLIGFLSQRLRRHSAEVRPQAEFLAIYFILGFLPCWASPGGMTRYCLPLYPALALLVGIATQRIAEAIPSPRLLWIWINGWKVYAATFVVIAGAVLIASVVPMPSAVRPWAQPLPICLAFIAAALISALCAVRASSAMSRRQIRTGVIGLAGFMVLTYAGIVVNVIIRRSADAPAAVAALKVRLPAGTRLASLNGVHHLFAYLFDQPIELLAWPLAEEPDLEWFCFSSVGDFRAPLPFAWEEVAVIPVDRNFHSPPENIVVVGRRRH
jgi:4-amino-4-deoxy-L-arabinose transferase-like glycosyltransferase